MFDNSKRIGVKLAIDDFSAGYSSLSYLSYLGFNELKIDKQFVRNIADSQKISQYAKPPATLRKVFKRWWSEGIESLSDAQYMRSYG